MGLGLGLGLGGLGLAARCSWLGLRRLGSRCCTEAEDGRGGRGGLASPKREAACCSGLGLRRLGSRRCTEAEGGRRRGGCGRSKAEGRCSRRRGGCSRAEREAASRCTRGWSDQLHVGKRVGLGRCRGWLRSSAVRSLRRTLGLADLALRQRGLPGESRALSTCCAEGGAALTRAAPHQPSATFLPPRCPRARSPAHSCPC